MRLNSLQEDVLNALLYVSDYFQDYNITRKSGIDFCTFSIFATGRLGKIVGLPDPHRKTGFICMPGIWSCPGISLGISMMRRVNALCPRTKSTV